MSLNNITLYGLPVVGEVHLPYVVVQPYNRSRQWVVVMQRQYFDQIMAAYRAVDMSRPTHICRVTGDGRLSVIRSWN